MFYKLTTIWILVIATLGVSACTPAPAALKVDNAQIRALVPGRDTTAGYFILHNQTQASVTLVGATSTAARAIEMHKTVQRGDSVGMQRVRQISVIPDETVTFEPGGLHLMIFGVTKIDAKTPITLLFSNGEQLDIAFSKLEL